MSYLSCKLHLVIDVSHPLVGAHALYVWQKI